LSVAYEFVSVDCCISQNTCSNRKCKSHWHFL